MNFNQGSPLPPPNKTQQQTSVGHVAMSGLIVDCHEMGEEYSYWYPVGRGWDCCLISYTQDTSSQERIIWSKSQ